ncbi:nucleotidyltransferase domain-containing protein [Lysinibacillus sp. 3P01SB]|uniref:nucleotidyltransferase domain-containing protein n=1 Tax=Lysinibacillus sp. 3P01SB TaxID=3132284 RepID=UPI0039A6C323
MKIEEAVKKLVASLKQDQLVQAIFLKGSMGRNEHDEYSDIDLYCLVDKEDVEKFLPRRLDHVRAYKELLFHDDIYIIAPQILAVYEDLVHLDLFTVTKETYIAKDLVKVLYDPDGRLDALICQHSLSLEKEEYGSSISIITATSGAMIYGPSKCLIIHSSISLNCCYIFIVRSEHSLV